MLCTTTLYDEKEETENCILNSVTVANYARRFLLGRWSFLGPGSEKKWFGMCDKPEGDGDKTAELMMLNFVKSGHRMFRATSALRNPPGPGILVQVEARPRDRSAI